MIEPHKEFHKMRPQNDVLDRNWWNEREERGTLVKLTNHCLPYHFVESFVDIFLWVYHSSKKKSNYFEWIVQKKIMTYGVL